MSIEALLMSMTNPLPRLIMGLAGGIQDLLRPPPAPDPSTGLLDLSPDAFVGALDEWGIYGPRREALQTEYRRRNSPLSGAFDALPETPSGMRRGNIVPFLWPEGTSLLDAPAGDISLAWPGFLTGLAGGVLDAVDIPSAALRGLPVSQGEMENAAMSVADLGLGRGTGTAVRALAREAPSPAAVDSVTLGMFGGDGTPPGPRRPRLDVSPTIPAEIPDAPASVNALNRAVPEPPDRLRAGQKQPGPGQSLEEATRALRSSLWSAVRDGSLPLQELASLPDSALAAMSDWRANVWTRAREWAWARPGVVRPPYDPGRSARARPGPEPAMPQTREMRDIRRGQDAQRAADELAAEIPAPPPRRTRPPTDPTLPDWMKVETKADRTIEGPGGPQYVKDRNIERREWIENQKRLGVSEKEAVQAWARRHWARGVSVSDEPAPSLQRRGDKPPPAEVVREASPGVPRTVREAQPPAPTTAERFWGPRRREEMLGPRQRTRQGEPGDAPPQAQGATPPRVADTSLAPRERRFKRAAPAVGSDSPRLSSLDDRLRAEGPLLKRLTMNLPLPARRGRRIHPKTLNDPAEQVYGVPRDLYEEVFRGELPGPASRTVVADDMVYVPRDELPRFRDAYNEIAEERGWQKARVEPETAVRYLPDDIRGRFAAVMGRPRGKPPAGGKK